LAGIIEQNDRRELDEYFDDLIEINAGPLTDTVIQLESEQARMKLGKNLLSENRQSQQDASSSWREERPSPLLPNGREKRMSFCLAAFLASANTRQNLANSSFA
jgi:hypothetical protein